MFVWFVSKALKNYWGAGNVGDFVKKQLCLTMLFLMNTESVIILLAP